MDREGAEGASDAEYEADAKEEGDGLARKLGLAFMEGSGLDWKRCCKDIQDKRPIPITISYLRLPSHRRKNPNSSTFRANSRLAFDPANREASPGASLYSGASHPAKHLSPQ